MWQKIMKRQGKEHFSCNITGFGQYGKHISHLGRPHRALPVCGHRLAISEEDREWHRWISCMRGGWEDGYSYYQDTCTCVTPTSQLAHESRGHRWD